MRLLRRIPQNIILLQFEHTHKIFLLLTHVLNKTWHEVDVRKGRNKTFLSDNAQTGTLRQEKNNTELVQDLFRFS